MDDHDQRFKTLLEEFLPEFMALFFPDWVERFDFPHTEWLKQEAFLDPPEGEKRVLDLVAKVPTTVSTSNAPEDCLLLIHLEVDSATSTTSLHNRLLQYYAFLRRKHALPVLPIGLYLNVGLNGLGTGVYEETLWGRTLLRFEYASIGLPALDAREFLRGSNLLGIVLSPLMQLPTANRPQILIEGIERIADSDENEYRKHLLAECFENYFPLQPGERDDYNRLVAERHTEGRRLMNGLELRELRGERRGEQRGALISRREIVVKLLTKKFGPLPDAVLVKIESASVERLDEILLAVLDAKSLAELDLIDPV